MRVFSALVLFAICFQAQALTKGVLPMMASTSHLPPDLEAREAQLARQIREDVIASIAASRVRAERVARER